MALRNCFANMITGNFIKFSITDTYQAYSGKHSAVYHLSCDCICLRYEESFKILAKVKCQEQAADQKTETNMP